MKSEDRNVTEEHEMAAKEETQILDQKCKPQDIKTEVSVAAMNGLPVGERSVNGEHNDLQSLESKTREMVKAKLAFMSQELLESSGIKYNKDETMKMESTSCHLGDGVDTAIKTQIDKERTVTTESVFDKHPSNETERISPMNTLYNERKDEPLTETPLFPGQDNQNVTSSVLDIKGEGIGHSSIERKLANTSIGPGIAQNGWNMEPSISLSTSTPSWPQITTTTQMVAANYVTGYPTNVESTADQPRDILEIGRVVKINTPDISGYSPPTAGYTQLEESPTINQEADQTKMVEVRPTRYVAKALPPCRVCGNRATGFHYGANTCEACKGFFRRCLLGKGTKLMECTRGGNCEIKGDRKAECPGCRFKKCLAVGMSRQGIKRGRYTLEKKMNVIKEVKQLQEDPDQLERGTTTHNAINIVPSIHNEVISAIVQGYLQVTNEQGRVGPPTGKQPEIEDKDAGITTAETPVMECYTNCHDNNLSDKEKFERSMSCIENGVRRFVQFAKSIPGFSKLCTDDQISLVKVGQSDWFLFSNYSRVNTDVHLYTSSDGSSSSKAALAGLLGADFVETFFYICTALKRLNMDSIELPLICAICVTSTDRCTLRYTEVVDRIHWQVVEALQSHVTTSYPRDTTRLARILMIPTLFRDMDILHVQAKDSLLQAHADKMSPLILEILSG